MLKVFTVHDGAVGAYLQPFFCPSRGVAVRLFTECCNDPKHQFFKYPGDYNLFELGSFDEQSGTFDLDTKVNLGTAVEYKNVSVPEVTQVGAGE